ncbi:MAG: hypothetical protein QF718_09375 [Phycisphaerales bacterium]|jgi:hypothetical protein|nr:hypothetical protein [Phycisphaerales bacterium]
MKRKDDTIAILFITALTIVVWFWAAGKTKHSSSEATILHFKAPEGSNTTITPNSQSIVLTFSGPRAAVNAAKEACVGGLNFSLALPDGEQDIVDLVSKINQLDKIKDTGAAVTAINPTSIKLNVQTIDLVEASVDPIIPNVTVSGDVTVDPATVTLRIPKELRKNLPDAITVTAMVSDTAVELLQPGIVHTRSAIIQLPEQLDSENILVEPSRVSVTFKIQSKTEKADLQQVRILLAGPPEDYSEYSVVLPRKVITGVSVEADADIIDGIKSGNVKVFAILRLASSDMEQKITSKTITTFLAITEDGLGHELTTTVEDPSSLNVELTIEPIVLQTQ